MCCASSTTTTAAHHPRPLQGRARTVHRAGSTATGSASSTRCSTASSPCRATASIDFTAVRPAPRRRRLRGLVRRRGRAGPGQGAARSKYAKMGYRTLTRHGLAKAGLQHRRTIVMSSSPERSPSSPAARRGSARPIARLFAERGAAGIVICGRSRDKGEAIARGDRGRAPARRSCTCRPTSARSRIAAP